ncbi:hypothetical protein MMC29_003873 [Sticta canariensis]|nr:hypothetical protein [Sticta canariensis]
MPARIEKRDPGSEEPPRKKRRVSADPEVARNCKRRRHLEDVDESKRNQPIPKNKFIDDWFSVSDWSRKRKSSNEMSQLPSPGGTATTSSQKSTATASTRKSTASVHDTDYRVTLEQYNIYIMDKEPNPEFIERANNIILRQRETPELDDVAVRKLRASMRELQNEGEEDVKNKLGAVIIPGFNTPPNEKLHVVSGQLWTKSIPVPLDQNVLAAPLPLPKPKPDKAFGYAKVAFNASQLSTINVLAQVPLGPSFASPYEGLRFPFFVIELKSQAKDGSIRVARNQAAGAGAVALNGILELMSRGSTLDDFDLNQPLFFSVAMDQEFAGVNAHWIGKNPDTNQYTFNLEELKMLPLKYDDSIQVLQRAIKNIFDYAADPHLKPILDALDEHRKAAESVEKTQDEVELRAPLSSPQPPPPNKKVKRMAAPSRIGHVASKAREETIERRTRSMQNAQPQVQPPGVRTRRTANLADS